VAVGLVAVIGPSFFCPSGVLYFTVTVDPAFKFPVTLVLLDRLISQTSVPLCMVMFVLDTATTLPVNSDVCARAIWLARVAVSKRRSKDLVFISQLKAAQLETTSRCCGLMPGGDLPSAQSSP